MKVKLAVIALGALALVSNAANAQPRTTNQAHARHLSRTFGQAYGFVPREATQYESNSQGIQSYPNPDRGPYPTPCGSCRL
jgi:hypothetical protein